MFGFSHFQIVCWFSLKKLWLFTLKIHEKDVWHVKAKIKGLTLNTNDQRVIKALHTKNKVFH